MRARSSPGRLPRGGAIAEDRERQAEHPTLKALHELGGRIAVARA